MTPCPETPTLTREGMGLDAVLLALRPQGVTVTRNKDGDYRVVLLGYGRKAEDHAYYTGSLDDAYQTGLSMIRNMRQLGFRFDGRRW